MGSGGASEDPSNTSVRDSGLSALWDLTRRLAGALSHPPGRPSWLVAPCGGWPSCLCDLFLPSQGSDVRRRGRLKLRMMGGRTRTLEGTCRLLRGRPPALPPVSTVCPCQGQHFLKWQTEAGGSGDPQGHTASKQQVCHTPASPGVLGPGGHSPPWGSGTALPPPPDPGTVRPRPLRAWHLPHWKWKAGASASSRGAP